MDKHKSWIEKHYPTYESAYGKCQEAVLMMWKDFPELTQVRGVYLCPQWGQREHWWLMDANGGIVDPTVVQFPSRGRARYVAETDFKTEGIRVVRGRCPDCGSDLYKSGQSFCGEECERSYKAYVEGAAQEWLG